MALRIVHAARSAAHQPPPGHPERPERAEVMADVVADWRARARAEVVEPRPASREELCRVHDAAYVDRVESGAGQALMLDPDTFTSTDSVDVARLAAGAACQAVEIAIETNAPACAIVRPPGHHAERDRAMGFCLFNNVAVAAAHGRALGLSRVAVVDFDVHHGNGTQAMFYDDPSVLYVSTHQFPYYPGTGAATEVGTGAGAGFTVNLPLEAGAGDADYDTVFRRVVVPVLTAFAPELLLVSAGYDLHERDPLGSMRVTTSGVARLVNALHGVSEQSATAGRLVLVTEGGYDLEALRACLDVSFTVLSSAPVAVADVEGPAIRGDATTGAARRALSHWWPTL